MKETGELKRRTVDAIVVSICLLICLGILVLLNDIMQEQADSGVNGPTNLKSRIDQALDRDPKFEAIIPRLTLTETFTPTDTTAVITNAINELPEPLSSISLKLPGVQAELNNTRAHDQQENDMLANKTQAKLEAWVEARVICNVVKNSTPTHIVTTDNKKIELLNPENLPAYLDYCGGDAASYKDALSAVVIKRDLAAEEAKSAAEIDAYNAKK